MKQLSNILDGYQYTILQGNAHAEVHAIHHDSRKIKNGDMFVAINGEVVDGHRFIAQTIEAGAGIVLCETPPEKVPETVTVVKVKNTRDAIAYIANNWYNRPSDTMKVIGITGTNGKTTTASMLYALFRDLGYPCGLFSTVQIKINDQEIPATHTTPGPLDIQQTMAQMRDAGCEYCFMEVSSHAVVQHRVHYIDFNAGVFTNITQDHLDYHQTFQNYIKAKQQFFDMLPAHAFAIYNTDDRNGKIMVQNTKARTISYGLKRPADYKAKLIKMEMEGMLMEINDQSVWSMLTGQFNAYNLMGIYAAACQFYNDSQEILTIISKQKPVRGRFEHISTTKNVHGIIDYAHTPDAVKNVLVTINEVRTGNEQLIVVIGAGGDRDKTKRPLMAANVCQYADTVVFTSDNPRTEDPEKIIQDMKTGIPVSFTGREFTVEKREEAIKVACGLAQANDIILVAGKGHETYQEVNGKRHHFDDREILLKYLK